MSLFGAAHGANHYDTLGVSRDASPKAIKAAYRKAALREHPDKQRGRGNALRSAAATRMERLNEAYATLVDPERRSRYDAAQANPFNRFHQHYHPQHRYEPVVVKATVSCTLEQLGGYEAVEVSLEEVFGVSSRQQRRQQLTPLRVFLPAGSRSGEQHRFPLPQFGAILVLKTTFEAPHKLYARHGDNDLKATVWLPAWQNQVWWRLLNRWRTVRIRAICGNLVTVCGAGEVVSPPSGIVRKLHGYGLPVRRSAGDGGDGSSPYACARGELRVHLRLRTLEESALRYGGAASVVIGCSVVLLKASPWRLLLRLLLGTGNGKRVLSVWTGPGPGIGPPFKIWGQGGRYYAYKIV